jgi:hypothetical protein
VPREESLCGQSLGIVTGRIQSHLDNTIDVAIRGFEATDVDSEAASDRGTNLFGIKRLSLDFAALEHVGRESL